MKRMLTYSVSKSAARHISTRPVEKKVDFMRLQERFQQAVETRTGFESSVYAEEKKLCSKLNFGFSKLL